MTYECNVTELKNQKMLLFPVILCDLKGADWLVGLIRSFYVNSICAEIKKGAIYYYWSVGLTVELWNKNDIPHKY